MESPHDAMLGRLQNWKEIRSTERIDSLLSIWLNVPDLLVASFIADLGEVAARRLDWPHFEKFLPGQVPPSEAIPLLEGWIRASHNAREALARVRRVGEAYDRDPRLSDLMVALLSKPPVKPSTLALDEALWAILEGQRDPRAIEHMRTVAQRKERKWRRDEDGEHWRDGRWVNDAVGAAFNQRLDDFYALRHRAEWRKQTLPTVVRQRVIHLLKAFKDQQRYGAAGRAKELLATVAKNYEDDAPRQVYADVLTELDDPRGEFILLQIAQKNGTSTRDGNKRAKALLKEHAAQWTQRIAPAIRLRANDFQRGFLTSCRIVRSDLDTLRLVASAPDWGTVYEVELHPKHLQLLMVASFTSLGVVKGVTTPEHVRILAQRYPRLDGLTLARAKSGSPTPRQPSGLQRL
ncbi:MAG: TIGR02996 domain-containing protein, partial [Proteobacteria bacterium]|nr:TIGR02996 domain-containing protein [Pseudomonadota bacterium]